MSDEILALLDKRIREAEKQILNSEPMKRMRAKWAHEIMEHGSMEICRCPEWADKP